MRSVICRQTTNAYKVYLKSSLTDAMPFLSLLKLFKKKFFNSWSELMQCIEVFRINWHTIYWLSPKTFQIHIPNKIRQAIEQLGLYLLAKVWLLGNHCLYIPYDECTIFYMHVFNSITSIYWLIKFRINSYWWQRCVGGQTQLSASPLFFTSNMSGISITRWTERWVQRQFDYTKHWILVIICFSVHSKYSIGLKRHDLHKCHHMFEPFDHLLRINALWMT